MSGLDVVTSDERAKVRPRAALDQLDPMREEGCFGKFMRSGLFWKERTPRVSIFGFQNANRPFLTSLWVFLRGCRL